MTMQGMQLDVSDKPQERTEEDQLLESNLELAVCLFRDKLSELVRKQGSSGDFDWVLPNGTEIKVSLEVLEVVDDD